MRTAAAVVFVAAAVTAWRTFPVRRYAVDGPSMEPSYHAGDRLLVNRWAYIRSVPQPGDVVVLRDPEYPSRHLIKRVATAPGDAPRDLAEFYVLGDNAAMSRDSRHFGAIPRAAIIGQVWRRY